MPLERSSFSFRFSNYRVSVELKGHDVVPESQLTGEFILRQDHTHQKRFRAYGRSLLLEEFPVSTDRYAQLRFASHQLTLRDIRAQLGTLSASLNLHPTIYEKLAPWVLSLARKFANPNRSVGFAIIATLKILSVDFVDQVFDDLSESMGSLAITSSIDINSSLSSSFKTVVARDDDEAGPCSICLEELTGGGELVRMPCSHVYHKSCILRWFDMRKKSCPVCRYNINVQLPEFAAALSNRRM